MKCKICGHRSISLAAMAKHYRQKHPSRMKHRTSKKRESARKVQRSGGKLSEILEQLSQKDQKYLLGLMFKE